MTDVNITPPGSRVLGYDFARAVAIVGMVLINFPIFLASLDGEAGGPLAWVANLHFGRAAALFVTLAGAGIALMSRGAERWIVRRTLLLRALFLFVLGNLLILVWRIDILHFYAFYLAIAALLFVALPRWALLFGAALVAAATLAVHIAWPDVGTALEAPLVWPAEDGATYWSLRGMAQDVFISGAHPVLPWLAFLMVGMWVGRHDLGDAATRGRLMCIGAALGLGAPILSSLLELAPAAGLLPDQAHLYLGVLHAPSPLYVLGASGTSIFMIALSQWIVARWPSALVVRAMVHAGQMALTLYLAHALLGVVIPQWLGVGLMPLAVVLAYALIFSGAMVAFAHLYRRRFKRGPVEFLMRAAAGSPSERAGTSTAARLDAPPRSWPALAAAAAALVLALQFVGLPPRIGCDETGFDGARARGRLTLLCPRQSFALTVSERADVTIETNSSRDLVLELYDGDERIAQNDDGGVGANARLVATLDPGVYGVVARPFESAVGAFMLTRRDRAPTLRELQPGQICSDGCASARDGECDDGGPGALYAVCDIGSDCADCGVRSVDELQGLLDGGGQLCFDACATARDGECDDGGPDSLYSLCTLGSDCADCGPREAPLSQPARAD